MSPRRHTAAESEAAKTATCPRSIRFLGYNPLFEVNVWERGWFGAGALRGRRRIETALRPGVDRGTLARWERGEREPTGKFLKLVNRFVNYDHAEPTGAWCAG
jgi:hypothetical protein